MIYTWDNKHRDETIRMCIASINRVKGTHAEFNYCKIDSDKITVWVQIKGKGRSYAIYLFWLDLAVAIQKQNVSEINFEKLTDKQYLKLCKYIVKEIWRVVKVI